MTTPPVTRGPLVLLACVLVVGIGACKGQAPQPRPAVTDVATASAGVDTASKEGPTKEGPTDCPELGVSEDPKDWAILPSLCPELEHPPSVLREALLAARSPRRLSELQPALVSVPELAGLSLLVRMEFERAPQDDAATEPLPDPSTLRVTPIDEGVLEVVARAHHAARAKGISHEERTRARAILARVHLQAFASLGLPKDRPLPPLAALLAARGLHYGGEFCRAYWARRVAGLEPVFAATEALMLDALLSLQASPHAADDGLTTITRTRARSWVENAMTSGRLPPQKLVDPRLEIDRLLEAGFVDLACARAKSVVDEVGSVELAASFETRLREFGFEKSIARARVRLGDLPKRAAPSAPKPLSPRPWPSAPEVADELRRRWLPLPQAELDRGFPRRRAIARLELALRLRPDAKALLAPDESQRSATSELERGAVFSRAAARGGLHDR